MTLAPNPYGEDLGARDARGALRETPDAVRTAVTQLGETGLGRRLAPAKWTASEILVHLAQVEVMFQSRLRLGLTAPGLVFQPFDQDAFMSADPTAEGRTAFEAYFALRRFALPLIDRLGADELGIRMQHADYGEVSVGWLLAWCAGHERRHLAQLRRLVGAR